MRDRPAPPGVAFTDRLREAPLEVLLSAAQRNLWPDGQSAEAWHLLRNWAAQTETLLIDIDEDAAWERDMAQLRALELSYEEWTERRLTALRARQRARKLAQSRVRDRYGYKRPRRWGLIARDVQELHTRWTAANR